MKLSNNENAWGEVKFVFQNFWYIFANRNRKNESIKKFININFYDYEL